MEQQIAVLQHNGVEERAASSGNSVKSKRCQWQNTKKTNINKNKQKRSTTNNTTQYITKNKMNGNNMYNARKQAYEKVTSA